MVCENCKYWKLYIIGFSWEKSYFVTIIFSSKNNNKNKTKNDYENIFNKCWWKNVVTYWTVECYYVGLLSSYWWRWSIMLRQIESELSRMQSIVSKLKELEDYNCADYSGVLTELQWNRVMLDNRLKDLRRWSENERDWIDGYGVFRYASP